MIIKVQELLDDNQYRGRKNIPQKLMFQMFDVPVAVVHSSGSGSKL
jgi:hypothetical protein